MKTFEQQLAGSARRLRDADNYRLPAPRPPRRRLAWGWLTTPAAAIAGLLAGSGLPRQAAVLVPQVAEVRTVDTVVSEHTVRDTVYVPVPATSPAPRPAESRDEVTAARRSAEAFRPDTSGCNVLCDGVDYSLLVSL